MARLRTGNRRAKRQQRRAIMRQRVQRWMDKVTPILAASLGCEDRPWFKLEVKG